MKIACLSGKGGAGKTFVAVNLATVASDCTYIDCDVEEPNGRLFFKPQNITTQRVYKNLPEFDKTKCNGCRKCVDFCKFNALFYIKDAPMVFSDICHSCGGCEIVCDQNAVLQKQYSIGSIEVGMHNNVKVVTGILDVGESSGVPIIKEGLKHSNEKTTIIDCPPGSACSVMESIQCCDYCVLVAEPTAFGLHNVKMVHELAKLFNKPCGFVINKQLKPYEPLEYYLRKNNLTVLKHIAYDSDIANVTSNGQIAVEIYPRVHQLFSDILEKIRGAL